MTQDYFRIVPVGGSPSARKRTLHMVCDFSRWEDSKGGQRDHCKRVSNSYRVATLDFTQNNLVRSETACCHPLLIFCHKLNTSIYVGDVVETTRSGENVLVGKEDQRVKLGLLIQCRRWQSGQAGFDPEIMINFA